MPNCVVFIVSPHFFGMGISYNTSPTKSLQSPYRIPTLIASFDVDAGKAISHRFYRLDINRMCGVRLNSFPQYGNGAGDAVCVAPLVSPRVVTYLLCRQNNPGVSHEVMEQ